MTIMAITTLRSLVTLTLLLVFVGIVAWAWSGRSRQRFEQRATKIIECVGGSLCGLVAVIGPCVALPRHCLRIA